MASDNNSWRIIIPFRVGPGDTEGVITEAIFEAGLEFAPSDAAGMAASGDTATGNVELVFTLDGCDEDDARAIARDVRDHIRDAVFSGDDVSVVTSHCF